MTFKEIREHLNRNTRCYALAIYNKNSDRNYCTNHKKHHRYWVFPTIEIVPRPRWGFDRKKELIEFIRREFP